MVCNLDSSEAREVNIQENLSSPDKNMPDGAFMGAAGHEYIGFKRDSANNIHPTSVIDASKVIFKIKGFDHIRDYFRHRLFLFVNRQMEICCAISDQHLGAKNFSSDFASDKQGKWWNLIPNKIKESITGNIKFGQIYLVKDSEFDELIERSFAVMNTVNSKYRLDLLSPEACAKNVNYAKTILCIFIWFICFLAASPVFFILINNLLYLSHIIFRTSILFSSRLYDRYLDIYKPNKAKLPRDEDLPIYTVLIPLYKEFYKLKSIINAMDNIDYPKDKMDVKLIIEEDDELTLKALKIIDLNKYIHVIKVPFSLPRTKPKALNYAMSYARGEYVVIYDAEDVPEKDQLRKALFTFQKLPKEYVCLQAKLNFYNAKENLLTKFFAIEYGLLFNYLLKGLSVHGMPVPLGGTSNHFKIFALNEIGRWDAYNVTEDADMGIRLSMRNYKTYVFDSTTYEESPVSLGNWMHQRSRWIKGFIQTSIIFLMDRPKRNNLSFMHRISVYIFLCLTPYSFFCLPWMFLAGYFASESYMMKLTLITSFISLIYLYSTAFFVTQNLQIKTRIAGFAGALLFWPFYFILHVIASYISIFQSITNPFKWNKTKHGESNKNLDTLP